MSNTTYEQHKSVAGGCWVAKVNWAVLHAARCPSSRSIYWLGADFQQNSWSKKRKKKEEKALMGCIVLGLGDWEVLLQIGRFVRFFTR